MFRIGVDLGGTNTAAGLVNARGEIVDRESVKTLLPTTAERIRENIVHLCRRLMTRNGLTATDVESVGVGVPCTADRERGYMVDAEHLGFPEGAVVQPLEELLGIPVKLDNDANCAAWGEFQAGEYGTDPFLLVTLGTGIGGGIILGGQLLSGVNNAAGELGHMVIAVDGEPCCCGRRGCFEAYASATALIRQARVATGENITEAKTVFDRASAGDPVCIGVLDKYTDYLAEGLANLINIFGPGYVCIGGGVSMAGDALLMPVQRKVWERTFAKTAARQPQVLLARLNNDAGILGAALL